ncbi:MAG: flagellar basal body L-ring protein FlgH [Thermanaerothrix sp.]|nr:flagellar basal body L-ring protein FlgH [Thermanaerothrix sp.]
MFCRGRFLWLGALFFLVLGSPGYGESLWQDGGGLFADRRPSKVGDIVTVQVSETTDTKDEGKLTTSKSDSSGIKDGTGILDFIKAFSIGGSSNSSGNSKTERKHNLTTSISCVVTEVLPNGNMVIVGQRDVVTQEEKLKISFTGVIRPEDVGVGNTIPSNRVANAEIRVEGKGSVSRVQRPGLFTQIIQALF